MFVHVWVRPVACPHSQQKAWPQRHSTRLQPPFFSTGLEHLGQGLVLAESQLEVSLPSRMRRIQSTSMSHVAGECGASQHAKQNCCPHSQSTCSAGWRGREGSGQ